MLSPPIGSSKMEVAVLRQQLAERDEELREKDRVIEELRREVAVLRGGKPRRAPFWEENVPNLEPIGSGGGGMGFSSAAYMASQYSPPPRGRTLSPPRGIVPPPPTIPSPRFNMPRPQSPHLDMEHIRDVLRCKVDELTRDLVDLEAEKRVFFETFP